MVHVAKLRLFHFPFTAFHRRLPIVKNINASIISSIDIMQRCGPRLLLISTKLPTEGKGFHQI